MYENKARLLCTAEGSPKDLLEKIVTVSEAKNLAPRTSSRSRKNDDSNLCVDNELGFAKDRTISRYDTSAYKTTNVIIFCNYFDLVLPGQLMQVVGISHLNIIRMSI